MALAARSITEALRVFARQDGGEGPRRAPSSRPRSAHDELLAVVDQQTVTADPAWKAVLVYEPASILLDTLRFDVSNEEWQPFAHARDDEARSVLRIGAIRGGVLVALAAAERPEGRLSRLRVLVSPAFRQIGLGHLVLHRAVRALLHEGLLPYARLATTELAPRALARAVGFVSLRPSQLSFGLSPA
ncbi:GNAT family N-acetyltransferase [Gemmatimonas sp.]|uniref:GNAT family N-acetyltransferase n=1 Tax=Gemmatimonas sp. TaxID=1962908 RepID=UPI003F717EDB